MKERESNGDVPSVSSDYKLTADMMGHSADG